MKRILVGLLGVALALPASAGNSARAVRKTVEASMQVTGEVVIAPDGELQSYTIDGQEKLSADVNKLLARYLPSCVFDVVTASGKPETVKAKMSLQLIVRQTDDGGATMSVGDGVFTDPDMPRYVTARKLAPPTYPMSAWQSGMTGIVYVDLRLNLDGTVAEAHAERVDMTVVGSENELELARSTLAKAALAKAKSWTFEIAPQQLAMPGPVSVRVPVQYSLWDRLTKPAPKYGVWQQYVPGPYAPIPWQQRSANSGIGAMAPGQLYPLDETIRLRNPASAGS